MISAKGSAEHDKSLYTMESRGRLFYFKSDFIVKKKRNDAENRKLDIHFLRLAFDARLFS